MGALGLKVFLDVEGLVQGSFEEGLGVALENSRAVVCVLSEGSLDRRMLTPFEPHSNPIRTPFERTV